MPIIKSAKKKARQAIKHEKRNQATRTQVKTFMKKMVVLSKTNLAEAQKMLPIAYSVIDTACKKHILHKNNAAHKKARLSRLVAGENSKSIHSKGKK